MSHEQKEPWYFWSTEPDAYREYGIVLSGKEIVSQEIEYVKKFFPDLTYAPMSKTPSWVLNKFTGMTPFGPRTVYNDK